MTAPTPGAEQEGAVVEPSTKPAAVLDALTYARQYWWIGNEPETQAALTTLARYINDQEESR